MPKNRPLSVVDSRLNDISGLIKQIIEEKGQADVLEIGCGNGIPMHQLKLIFGDNLNIYGINKEVKHGSFEIALNVGSIDGVFSDEDKSKLQLMKKRPNFVVADAGNQIPFIDNSFDVIYSIITLPFVYDKFNLLVESNRVLKYDGLARIQYSSFMSENPKGYESLIYIGENGKEIPFKDFIKRFDSINHIKSKYFEIKKSEGLDFGVRLCDTIRLGDIMPPPDLTNPDKSCRMFVKSIYEVKSD